MVKVASKLRTLWKFLKQLDSCCYLGNNATVLMVHLVGYEFEDSLSIFKC